MKELRQGTNEAFLDQSTETLRALAHPIRMRIVELLFYTDSLTVTQIHSTLHVEQAVISHHLGIMRESNMVSFTKDGKNCHYKLVSPMYYEILQMMKGNGKQ
jgi:DNA-binding transcriptional ArsR family regulator